MHKYYCIFNKTFSIRDCVDLKKNYNVRSVTIKYLEFKYIYKDKMNLHLSAVANNLITHFSHSVTKSSWHDL